jgi:amidase
MNLTSLSATNLARMIRSREATSAEVVAAHYDRIDEVNPTINALVVDMRERATQQAHDADAALVRGDEVGPLHGVPFTVKDALAVAGEPFSGGTLGRKGVVADQDATVVTRMMAAGAILLGKTNVPEGCLALETDNFVYGRTNNPYGLDRTPGGSSGGESALIASGGSPIGIGSDAGGSIRQPAHCCGIAGLKPTAGRVPRTGHWPAFTGMTDSFNVVGPLARSVQDLATVFRVLVGPDASDPHISDVGLGDPAAIAIPGLRIAWFTDNGVMASDAATSQAVTSAVSALRDAGCEVTEDRPPGIERSFETLFSVWRADAGAGIRALLSDAGTEKMHPLTEGFQRKQGDEPISAAELAVLLAGLDELRSEMWQWMQSYDAIISPVNARPAVAHGTSVEPAVFPVNSYVYPFNLSGWPAVSVRGGTSPEGLPIGVQVGARPWREDVALALAGVVERASGGYGPPTL